MSRGYHRRLAREECVIELASRLKGSESDRRTSASPAPPPEEAVPGESSEPSEIPVDQ